MSEEARKNALLLGEILQSMRDARDISPEQQIADKLGEYALPVTSYEVSYDYQRRSFRILSQLSLCSLGARGEETLALNYYLAQEEWGQVQHRDSLIGFVAERIQRGFEFSPLAMLNPPEGILIALTERGCHTISYHLGRDLVIFTDALNEVTSIPPRYLQEDIDRWVPVVSGCYACKYFDKNPYIPCAVNPLVVNTPEAADCPYWEPKSESLK